MAAIVEIRTGGSGLRTVVALLILCITYATALPAMAGTRPVHDMTMSDCAACPDMSSETHQHAFAGSGCTLAHCTLIQATMQVFELGDRSTFEVAIAVPPNGRWEGVKLPFDLPPPRA